MKHRKLENNTEFTYITTNKLYEACNMYKLGKTINPYERKRIQANSHPANYGLYDKLLIISNAENDIEKILKEIASECIIKDGDGFGGTEWFETNDLYNKIIKPLFDVIRKFDGTYILYNNETFKCEKGKMVKLNKTINCRMSYLGIKTGDKVVCTINDKKFTVVGDKIDVDGKEMTLTEYCKSIGKEREYCGPEFFKYKGKNISSLFRDMTSIGGATNRRIK